MRPTKLLASNLFIIKIHDHYYPSQIQLISMDEMFDLDMALASAEDLNTELDKKHDDAQATAAARHMVDRMPAVDVVGCDEQYCAVCLEEFGRSAGGGKQVHCGHVFHENCIFQWLSIRDSCPLCRSKVQVIL